MAWPDPRSWRARPLWREGPLTPRAEVEECRGILGQRPSAALDELWALDPEDWVTALDERLPASSGDEENHENAL